MLFVRARLVSGERVLVQAGGSGVGVMAVQLAKALGCEVHATNSSPIRREKLAQLGAIPHPYEEGLKGMDVVVESVGGAVFESSVRALGWGGRLVCCGATAGADAKLNLRMLFFKQLDILGSTMGRRQDLVAAWEWVKEGRIKPVLDRVLPIEQLGEGHRLLESREVFGKVVLRF
jgi:NADPH:quinone reductase-like Zn-dependent oxidoreductase